MIKTIILIFIMFILTFGCKNRTASRCTQYKTQSAKYIEDYYMTQNCNFLNSALHIVDKALVDCEKDNFSFFAIRKLSILSLLRDYNSAICFIQKLHTGQLSIYGSFYEKSVECRFQAMKAQQHGDIKRRNAYLEQAMNVIQGYLDCNRDAVRDYLQDNSDAVLKGPYCIAFVQYFYYDSIIHGIDKTKERLNQMKNRNEIPPILYEYIEDFLSEDMMDFIGI